MNCLGTVRAKRRTEAHGSDMDPLISMAALGRPFQLGDLYDYRSDSKIPTSNTR